MNIVLESGLLRLTFNLLESRVLRQILAALIANYKVPPGEIDPKIAAVWYSTRGCETAHLTPDETRDWLEQLHGFKSANLALLQDWREQLGTRRAGHYELQLKPEHAPNLLTVLNDHRLLVAARNDIGQEEIDLSTLAAAGKLTAAQQVALFEIHLLAWIIEEILHLIMPEAASWMR